jgi:ADP-dependent NAD(P)H-hydrate dehydratase
MARKSTRTLSMKSVALAPLPSRPRDGHKGTFGTVIVIGGCSTMIGAPALCASAAFRAGAGLVKLATLPDVLPFAITIEPGATGMTLTGRVRDDLRLLERADPESRAVLAVGPGMDEAWPVTLVSSLLRGSRPVVLDADGLNHLAKLGRPRTGDAPLVLSPHPGEFRRLAEPLQIPLDLDTSRQRRDAAAALAKAHRAVVVLKGHHSVITDGSRVVINQTGNPALATAGSGDVLTGVIAALIAQGMTLFDAVTVGAHLHGLAADLWAARHGCAGLTARDLTLQLPDALAAYVRA